MRRRTAIRGCLAGAATALAGCVGRLPRATGPRNPPDAPADQPRRTPDRPALTVATFDFEADDDGRLRVFGTVENRGDARRIGTVRVAVDVDGEAFVREISVTVDSGATAEWAVSFDVAYDRFASGGGISVSVD
ncbi:transcriptional initiation protein Tat [Halobellus ruber]|uniref:Transcriptional initiation protein Tat n=1 Tax=Halobellus ruber TaxID=2761102 RepID=A0A7J9SKA1_9EURY|nr:transcriptional initiation protein Tat [Halobellus ruber]MBB6645451.1 transcriptional initiation protein Tat [Halobellus ruber]